MDGGCLSDFFLPGFSALALGIVASLYICYFYILESLLYPLVANPPLTCYLVIVNIFSVLKFLAQITVQLLSPK